MSRATCARRCMRWRATCSGRCGSCGRIGRRWRMCLRSWRREARKENGTTRATWRVTGDSPARGQCEATRRVWCLGMKKTLTIARKELESFFGSPIALDFFDDLSGRYAVCVLLGGRVFCPGDCGYPAAVPVDAADADFPGGGADDAAVERGAAVGDDRDADDAAAGALAGGAGQVPGGDGAGGGGAAADAADPGGGGDAGAAGLGPGDRRLPGGAAAGGGVCGAGTVAVGADGQPDRGAAGDGGDRRAALPRGHAGRHQPDGGALERAAARGGDGQPV